MGGETVQKTKTAPQRAGSGNRSVKIIEVIEVVTACGSGTETDPNRLVTEYWSKEGVLLAARDN